MNNLNPTLRMKITGAVLAAIVALTTGPIAFAEETTTAATPAAPKSKEERIAAKKERLDAFLEKHPNVKEKLDKNNDGSVDGKEARRAKKFMKERRQQNQGGGQWNQNGNGYGRRDNDNNPPGRRGGQGTNWERNDFKRGQNNNGRGYGRRDFDNNPPGARGGRGTNWENRPGSQGGPGASPDRKSGFKAAR